MTAVNSDVLVIGAGISGLSCARTLQKAGLAVRVVDSGSAVGGVVRSQELEGAGTIDLGPQTLRTGDPELIEDMQDLGIWDRRLVAGEAGKNRYVFWDGRLIALPSGPGSFLTSPVLPFGGKLRMLMEPLIPRGQNEDQSVADFFRARLGRHALERLVDPFVAGVYAGDPEGLSVDAVFGGMRRGVQEKGSLVRWGISRAKAARKEREASGRPRTRAEMFSFPGGLQEWPEAMAASLEPGSVLTGVDVTSVTRDDEGIWTASGTYLDAPWSTSARNLVVAVPAMAAAVLLGDLFPAQVRRLADISYAPVATVALAFDREDVAHPMDGFGCLFPSSQGRSILGILWISSLFPKRMVEGRVVTTTFVGGARQPEYALRDDDWILRRTLREHREILGVTGEPVAARVVRWKAAIPQYEFGHLGRVSAAQELEAEAPGLYLAASWRGGVSMGDCWKNGRAAGERLLRQTPAPTSSHAAGSS
jgi:oxygen-dependent protoporphyrinogen oxidase